MTVDLWGDISPAETLRTPTAILREQASLLAQKTRGLIEGDVRVRARGDEIEIGFYIVAPSLNNYHYHVLDLTHTLDIYPVEVFDRGIADTDQPKTCTNEKSLVEEIKRVFEQDRVRAVLRGLLAQIHSMEEPL